MHVAHHLRPFRQLFHPAQSPLALQLVCSQRALRLCFHFRLFVSNAHTACSEQENKKHFQIPCGALSLFSTLFTFPKAFIHQQDVSISESLFNILSGQSSWFICALVVAELLFVGLVQLFKGNKIAVSIVSLACFILATLSQEPNNNYWSAVQALIFMPFLCMGWIAKQHSFKISNKHFTLVLVLFIVLKVAGTQIHFNEVIAPMLINQPFLFMVDMIVGIALLIFIAQKINRNTFIEHVGKHSLICYFLCGGIPLLFTKLFEKIELGYNNAPYLLSLIFLFSTIIIVVAATLIQKYLGFLWTSKRKL